MEHLLLIGALITANIWLTIVTLISFVLITITIDKTRGVPFVIFGAYITIMYFLVDSESIKSIMDAPAENILGYIIGYVIIGLIWSFFKWFRLIRNFKTNYQEVKEEWMTKSNKLFKEKGVYWYFSKYDIDTNSRDIKDNLVYSEENDKFSILTQEKSWDTYKRYIVSFEIPKAKENKDIIINWMSFWIPSMLWTAFNTLIIELWEKLYKMVKGVYGRITDLALGDVAKELD